MSGLDEQVVISENELICENCGGNQFRCDIYGVQGIFVNTETEVLHETDWDMIREDG